MAVALEPNLPGPFASRTCTLVELLFLLGRKINVPMAVDKTGDIEAWLRDVDPFPLSEIPPLPQTSPGKPAALSLQEPPPGRMQPPMASKFPLRPVLKKEQVQRKLTADAPKEAPHPVHGASTSLVKSAAPSQLFACKEDSMVRFLLLRGHDLDPVDDRDSCDPYVVFKLGNEKYTSRVRLLLCGDSDAVEVPRPLP